MKTQGRKSWKNGKVEARIAMPAFQGGKKITTGAYTLMYTQNEKQIVRRL
jgi:hypothetical protein